MKCETVILADGMVAIVCRAKPRVRKCDSCHSAPGPLLCDWIVARVPRLKRCSKPICERCALAVGEKNDKHLCVIHRVAYRHWQSERGMT